MKMKGHPMSISIGFMLLLLLLVATGLQRNTILASGQAQQPYGRAKQEVVDADKVKEFIQGIKNEEMYVFDHHQLSQWFDSQMGENGTRVHTLGNPRLFALCVNLEQIIQGHTLNANFPNPHLTKGKEYLLGSNRPIRVPLNSYLHKFAPIIALIEDEDIKSYFFEKEVDNTGWNNAFVESIKLSRINTPEPDMVNLRQWVHITITMKDKIEGLILQSNVGPLGLPFGEFSVEFPCKDFPETKDIDKVGQIVLCARKPKANLYYPNVYVGYSPKDYQNMGNDGKKVWHVHFKYTDIACMQTPYMQFIMVIVKDFKPRVKGSSGKVRVPEWGLDYIAQLSPVFLNGAFDSPDGLPYPYYPGFEKNMWCNQQSDAQLKQSYSSAQITPSTKAKADATWEKIKWSEARKDQNFLIIHPNQEYDQCILYNPQDPARNKKPEGLTDEDLARYQCGPGPFKCDENYRVKFRRESPENARIQLIKQEKTTSECHPCLAPDCLEAGFDHFLCEQHEILVNPNNTGGQKGGKGGKGGKGKLPIINDLENETDVLIILDEQIRSRSHGVACSLAFLYLVPIANFVGRFYKEIWERLLFGNGPWIFAHLIFHMLALGAIWEAMGPLIPKLANYRHRRRACERVWNGSNNEYFENCLTGYTITTAHSVIGLIAIIVIHLVPLTGFRRPHSIKHRLILSYIHTIAGYLTYALGVLAVLFALISVHSCLDTVVFSSILIVLPFIFSAIVVLLDYFSDKRLGVKPMRKQCPVLEQLMLDSKGPFEIPKLIVLAVFFTLMTVIWMMTLISLYLVAHTGDKLIDGYSGFKGETKAVYLGKLQGLFGKCGKD